jgi:hypothetical protein
MTSPTTRTLALLRRRYVADVVERWVPRQGIKRDLVGVGDVLAVHPGGRAFLLVQATTTGHVAHRPAKSRGQPALAAWLRAQGAFQVWGWRQSGRRWRVKVAVDAAAGELGRLVDTLETATNLPERTSR